MFALLPYRVTGVSLHGPGEVRQGEVLKLQLRIEAAGAAVGTHAVHVSVTGPSENGHPAERRWYAQNVLVSDGEATVEIPLAYNDTPGKWIFEAKDVMTGVTGRAVVHLKPGTA